jgi:S1-C subfamily serine protease
MAFKSFHPTRTSTLVLAATLAWPLAKASFAAEEPSLDAKQVARVLEGANERLVENSVVKVFATVRQPDPYKPWSKAAPGQVSGSGVVIEGKRILSNAHVVLYASEVEIQANQAGDKLAATVEAIAPGIDLAVLKLEDESFFASHPPLPRATSLPTIKDAVLAYGYPRGGSSLSITKGIVSRIEFVSYNYPVSGLRIQIDAAINPGNSGGPAVVGDKMIGLAFSHLSGAENISYIIPCEEIDLFLQEVAAGRTYAKPALFDDFQTLENPALRAFLKLDKSVQGLVVHRPDRNDADYPLKEWDVVTRIADAPVDDQGMVKVLPDVRVWFGYLVQKVARDGKVALTLVRNGKEMSVQVPLSAKRPLAIPELSGRYPSYFVYGPIVFSEATTEFIAGLSRGTSSSTVASRLMVTGSPLISRMLDKPAFEGERLVVVSSPFFPHKLAKGYSSPFAQVIKTINGQAIKNLPHLVEVLRDCKDEFLRVEFNSRMGETLVFPRSEMLSATDGILTDNGVRSQGTPDVMAVWNANAGPSKP